MPAKGQKRKKQIIDVAKNMFLELGYQSTHIGEICKELKIARGTVYQYFSNKREILCAILESVEDELDDIFDKDDLIEFMNKPTSSKKMNEFIALRISKSIQILISEPIIIKLLFKEISGIDDEIVLKRIDKFVNYMSKILVSDFEEFKRRNHFNTEIDSKITAMYLIGGVLLVVHQNDKNKTDLLDKNVINTIVNIMIDGAFK